MTDLRSFFGRVNSKVGFIITTFRLLYIICDRYTYRQTDRQTDRKTDIQADR